MPFNEIIYSMKSSRTAHDNNQIREIKTLPVSVIRPSDWYICPKGTHTKQFKFKNATYIPIFMITIAEDMYKTAFPYLNLIFADNQATITIGDATIGPTGMEREASKIIDNIYKDILEYNINEDDYGI